MCCPSPLCPSLPCHVVPFLLRPPYLSTELTPASAPRQPGARGSLLLLRPSTPGDPLPVALAAVRRRFPALPVILWVEPGAPAALHLAGCAAHLQVRGVVSELTQPALRRALTRPVGFAGSVVAWLGMQGMRLPPRAARLVEAILDLAPEHPHPGPLLRAAGAPGLAARRYLVKHALPAPREWFRLARALHAVLRLQAEPARPLLQLAAELGYADPASLSRQLRQLFGVRPGEVRHALGWEWLLERWCARRLASVAAR